MFNIKLDVGVYRRCNEESDTRRITINPRPHYRLLAEARGWKPPRRSLGPSRRDLPQHACSVHRSCESAGAATHRTEWHSV